MLSHNPLGHGETILVIVVAGCGTGEGTLKGIDAARLASAFVARILGSASSPERVTVAVHLTVPGRPTDTDSSVEKLALWSLILPILAKEMHNADPEAFPNRAAARAAADRLGPSRVRLVVAPRAKGCSPARHSLERVAYRGEKWVLYADARISVIREWDVHVLRDWHHARVRCSRPVITHPAADDGFRNPVPVPLAPSPPPFPVFERFSGCGTPVFFAMQCGALPNRPLPVSVRSPDFAFSLAADAIGAAVHDPWLEHLQERDIGWAHTVRMWTAGCDFYCPSRAIAWRRRACAPPSESKRGVRLSITPAAEKHAAYFRLWSLVGLQPPIYLGKYGIVRGVPPPAPAPSQIVISSRIENALRISNSSARNNPHETVAWENRDAATGWEWMWPEQTVTDNIGTAATTTNTTTTTRAIPSLPDTHLPPRSLHEMARITGIDWRSREVSAHARLGLKRPYNVTQESELQRVIPLLWPSDELLVKYGSTTAFQAAVRSVLRGESITYDFDDYRGNNNNDEEINRGTDNFDDTDHNSTDTDGDTRREINRLTASMAGTHPYTGPVFNNRNEPRDNTIRFTDDRFQEESDANTRLSQQIDTSLHDIPMKSFRRQTRNEYRSSSSSSS